MSAAASHQAAAAGETAAAETAASERQRKRKRRWETLVEVVEVIVLAIVTARDHAERYLRDTVLFATVLFVVAIAQRFKVRAVRVTTTTIALAPAACTTAEMLTLPRA